MRLKLVAILAFSLFSFTSCSDSNNLQAIHGGRQDSATIVNGRSVLATEAYAKHTVAVAPPGGQLPCTGVIVAPNFILSAGHCASYFKGGDIFFGLEASFGKAVVYKIKNITLHPQYCPSCLGSDTQLVHAADLALVEFAEKLPTGFAPVQFAEHTQIVSGTPVYLAGYGADQNYKYDRIMKVVKVPVARTGASEFLTDEIKGGSCQGDSGGPAFIAAENKLLLAGITSRGDSGCRARGIYTIPVAHFDWIKKVIDKANQ